MGLAPRELYTVLQPEGCLDILVWNQPAGFASQAHCYATWVKHYVRVLATFINLILEAKREDSDFYVQKTTTHDWKKGISPSHTVTHFMYFSSRIPSTREQGRGRSTHLAHSRWQDGVGRQNQAAQISISHIKTAMFKSDNQLSYSVYHLRILSYSVSGYCTVILK